MLFKELKEVYKQNILQAFDKTSVLQVQIKEAFFSGESKDHNTKIFNDMVDLMKKELQNFIDTFDENIDDVPSNLKKICNYTGLIITNITMITLDNSFQKDTNGLHLAVNLFSSLIKVNIQYNLSNINKEEGFQ